jgi:hypothetical protein
MARKSRSARRSRELPAIEVAPPAPAPSAPPDAQAAPAEPVVPAVVTATPVPETAPVIEPAAPATEITEIAAPASSATAKSGRAMLSRELADFLVEFSIVLNKRSMYPAGHPHLQDSADRFVRRLNVLLHGRDSVTLGVARHRLVIETITTDASNALLRDLAHRLHRHRIASVHFTRGATLTEIESLLSALSADPQRGEGPLGKRLDHVGPWSHIRLAGIGYDQFALQESETGAEPDVERDSWIELAQLALANEGGRDTPTEDPLVVAEAIDRKSGEVAYDRVVLGYLARVAEEMSGRRGGAEDQLLHRVSKLIQALDADTLRRLLEAGANHAERRKFVLNASQTLAAEAVMEVVEAAANASHQTISDNLLRLLHKLAHHAEQGPTQIRAEAEGALRNNVARLVADWELEDPNPTAYNAILEGMVQRISAEHSLIAIQVGCDPEIIIKMAIELDAAGPAVYAAVEEHIMRGELVRVTDILKAAPRTDMTEDLWGYVATPERLEAELAASPINPESVAVLVERIGAAAADSLLDRLASADDRSTRAAIMKQLIALGPGIAATAARRLNDAPWFLQRNILVLLGRLGSWPDGFSPTGYAAHNDPRIRREAIKLLLEAPQHQADAVKRSLLDPDDGIVGLALTSALESCPPEAVQSVQQIAADPRRPSELRALAARILTRVRTPEALQSLLQVISLRRRWWLVKRMAPKSAELLAALAGLATNWRDDPAAAEVLFHARQHHDSQIRAAARSRPR